MEEQNEPSFPTHVACAQYHDEVSNSGAVARQLDVVGTHFPDQARDWGEEACKAVAFPCCEHSSCPPALTGQGSLKQRKEEAAAHPGLCGVHHACFIVAVSFADVAARGNGIATTKAFRNQASDLSLE